MSLPTNVLEQTVTATTPNPPPRVSRCSFSSLMRAVRAGSSPSGPEREAKRARTSHKNGDAARLPTIVCQQPLFSESAIAIAPTVAERTLITTLTPLPLVPQIPAETSRGECSWP